MPNIPSETPMTPSLYGVMQEYGLPLIDSFWNSCIGGLLSPEYESRMYAMMGHLYQSGLSLPAANARPNRTRLGDELAQLWVEPPLPGSQTPDYEVRRGSVKAMGVVFYDMVRTGWNGNGGTNGVVPYETARTQWEQQNAPALAQELAYLKAWLEYQP